VVALVVLVAVCCLLCARGSIQGTILNKTLLQETPGTGLSVLTTLYPTNVVEVLCRKSDVLVFDDPWWLQVNFVDAPTATTFTGWVADYDVNCGNAGNCDVPLC
jgi:hypothetical protein